MNKSCLTSLNAECWGSLPCSPGHHVTLDEELLINRGQDRFCYQHPSNPDLVIKIPSTSDRCSEQANVKELKGYRLISNEQADLSFLIHCYGFIDTNLGWGLMCDCIRDDDGSVSKSIWDIVVFQDKCDIDHIYQVVDDLCNSLKSRNIWIFDLNPKDIVLRRCNDGSYEPYIIDLKGRYESNDLFSFALYFKYFSMKKLERKSSQLLQRISYYRSRRAEYQIA